MGNCTFRADALDQTENSMYLIRHNQCIAMINKTHFNFHYVIGRGGFGKVLLNLFGSNIFI